MEKRWASIETEVSRYGECPSVIDFRVRALLYNDDEELVGEEEPRPIEELGSLSGFRYCPGFLPDEDDYSYFDVFDSRSGHAEDGFNIISNYKAEIEKALKYPIGLFSGVLFLEDAKVSEKHRGHGLALRLMREAKFIFGWHGLLVMLKAHPTQKTVSDADCLMLAKYYKSDKSLRFRDISRKKLPGWLVATGDIPVSVKSDDGTWEIGSD